MFTRWNWKQAGIHFNTKPRKSERRRQKDRERMTKYNQTKRMEFESNTRIILKEIASKLEIVFNICHEVISTKIDREVKKQLELKMTELKESLNFTKQNEDKESHQKEEGSNLLGGGTAFNSKDKRTGNMKSKRKKKK